jgi:predicted O-methyltransferase YrrM
MITLGGMKVIGFTDVIQVFFLILGGLVTTYLALNLVSKEFGTTGVLNGFHLMTTHANDHFHMIFNKTNPNYIDLPGLSVLIGGMLIINLNYWGCNQYITQRALGADLTTARSGILVAACLKVLMPRMLSGHYQGRVLGMLSNMLRPSRILEIGTFTGYATLCLAEGLTENGMLHTIDINQELESMVRGNFLKSDFNTRIAYHLGNALEIIPTLDEVFDLVFIDADKKNNANYYQMVFDKIRPGGMIIVDNVLWSGKVLNGAADKDTVEIKKFNEMVHNDTRVEKLILPVRDGLFVIRKK